MLHEPFTIIDDRPAEAGYILLGIATSLDGYEAWADFLVRQVAGDAHQPDLELLAYLRLHVNRNGAIECVKRHTVSQYFFHIGEGGMCIDWAAWSQVRRLLHAGDLVTALLLLAEAATHA